MSVDPTPVLRITRRFDIPPERVFDAWLDPGTTGKWLFASGGERIVSESDARVGGAWIMTDRRGGKDYTGRGEYLEIERPRRLAFTFAMPQFSPNSDRITVEVEAEGTGCVMTFSQEGVDIADELRQVPAGEAGDSEKGWWVMFDALAAALR